MAESKKVTSLLLVPMKDDEESLAHINSIRALLHKHATEIGHIVKEQVININEKNKRKRSNKYKRRSHKYRQVI